jgi:peroxiredoxin Q/BCP
MRSRILGSLALAAALVCGLTAANETYAQGKKAATLKVGDKAPAFESIDDQGKPWKSTDVIGKKIVVLYFYPADLTGGCTKQACGYRDDLTAINDKGVEVIGVSGDSPENHRLFKKVEKLNFTLLADEKANIAKKFGIPAKEGKATFDFKGADGVVTLTRGATISRYTVIIDRKGNIAAIDPVEGKSAGDDAKRIQDIVKGLDAK